MKNIKYEKMFHVKHFFKHHYKIIDCCYNVCCNIKICTTKAQIYISVVKKHVTMVKKLFFNYVFNYI